MLPLPAFFDPADITKLYIEQTESIAHAVKKYQQHYSLSPSHQDTEKIAVLGIDPQIGFMHPQASLYVPGAIEDATRALSFIYKNSDKISRLYFSLDTHNLFQIFHPAFWQDTQGQHPPAFTVITTQDIQKGTWQAIHHPEQAYQYCKNLEENGKKNLIIWPYHTLLGGLSHALLPAIMQAAIFHALLRNSPTHFEIKGTHPLTENYSIFEPEIKHIAQKTVGSFNEVFFNTLMRYDRIYIWGEASSHCVVETLYSLQHQIQTTHPDNIHKLYILEDAMSPVAKMGEGDLDFPLHAQQALQHFAQAGMHLVKTTDVI